MNFEKEQCPIYPLIFNFSNICEEVHTRKPYQVEKYKPVKHIPCFSRLGLDKKGMPKVEVAFPDGTTDIMKLGMFRGRPGSFIGESKIVILFTHAIAQCGNFLIFLSP